MDLKVTPTDRGFLRGEFVDLYGANCSIQESSLATDNAIWLGVNGEGAGRRMHLNQEQVAALLPFLTHFAEHGDLRISG